MTATLQAPDAPALSPVVEASTPPVSLTSPAEVLDDIRRNPLIVALDLSDVGSARSFRAHRAAVKEAVQGEPIGSLIATVQAHPKGFWISEWTLVGSGHEEREPRRRRIARGTTLESTYAEFATLLSFDSSHYFRPEEGLRGWWQRV